LKNATATYYQLAIIFVYLVLVQEENVNARLDI